MALLAQAVGLAVLHWILGLAVRRQEMSLAGLSTDTMSLSTWIGGALLGAFLLLCAVLLARAALRDRLGGRLVRAALVGALVTQAVLATLSVGLAGWAAFVGLMTVFGLLLLTLSGYPPEAAPAPRRARRRPGGGRGARAAGSRPVSPPPPPGPAASTAP